MLDLEAIRVTRDEVYPTRARLAAADVKDISTWQHVQVGADLPVARPGYGQIDGGPAQAHAWVC